MSVAILAMWSGSEIFSLENHRYQIQTVSFIQKKPTETKTKTTAAAKMTTSTTVITTKTTT